MKLVSSEKIFGQEGKIRKIQNVQKKNFFLENKFNKLPLNSLTLHKVSHGYQILRSYDSL